MKTQQPLSLEEQRAIAEEIVGTPIEWESDVKGYFLCPMAAAHTTPTKQKHTICYLEGVPTYFCWHQSCKSWMEDASRDLRSKLDTRTTEQKREDKKKTDERIQLRADALRVRRNLEWIYKDFAWDLPGPVVWDANQSMQAFLQLWEEDDVIWIGDVFHTGAVHGHHFQYAGDWRLFGIDGYHYRFTTGSTYKPGCVDRTQENVQVTKYVVIEFDSLDISPEANKQKSAAILNWLRVPFDLRMVVDSGNKSLHGWFANDKSMTNEAKFFLRQLGADMQTMRPSQPVRLPGGRRDNGNIQNILWLP